MKQCNPRLLLTLFGCILTSTALPHLTLARDAAFMDPGMSATGDASEAFRVEPKSEIDTGETLIGVAKHTNLFLVNQTSLPIKIEKIIVNSDSNVNAEILTDDCSKQGTIQPLSRCNIELSETPSNAGTWGVDIVITHNGPGRIMRAKISGKTTGPSADQNKQMGLALNTKDSGTVNFGEVEVGTGKAVRSAVMVNDSTDAITLYSIDVVEADNGLHRIDHGCTVGLELKPGQSCPVTLLWMPTFHGNISTDLIIRHSGKLGFSVIPIRGTVSGTSTLDAHATRTSAVYGTDLINGAALPPPLPGSSLESEAGKIAARALGAGPHTARTPRLIGTIGNRAILLKADNSTAILTTGDVINVGQSKMTITTVSAKAVEASLDGKKIILILEASPDLLAHAAEELRAEEAKKTQGSSSSGGPSSTLGGSK